MKKLTKIVAALCLVSAATLPTFAKKAKVEKTKKENVKVNVGVLKGPSGIPMAEMMEDQHYIRGASLSYETFAAANQLLPKLVKNEIQIGFLPPNVAAKAYNANKSIVTVAITGNGMLSLLTKDMEIFSIRGVAGKTVYVAGQGATPEYVTRYLIDKVGVENVQLDFSIPNAEIVPAFIAGQIDYAIVPEPFTTIARLNLGDKLNAIDLQREFSRLSSVSNYPMTVMVANADFAKNNEDLIEEFLKAYKNAHDWTMMNPKTTGKLCEKHDLGMDAKVVANVANSLQNGHYVYIEGKNPEAKKRMDELLNIFLTFDEASVGGKLPDQGFYR